MELKSPLGLELGSELSFELGLELGSLEGLWLVLLGGLELDGAWVLAWIETGNRTGITT